MQSVTMYVDIALICKENMASIVAKTRYCCQMATIKLAECVEKISLVHLPLKPMEMIHFLAVRHHPTRRIPCVKMKLTFSVHFPYG